MRPESTKDPTIQDSNGTSSTEKKVVNDCRWSLLRNGSESRGRTTSGSSPVTGLGRPSRNPAANHSQGITSRKMLLPETHRLPILCLLCVSHFLLFLPSVSSLFSFFLSPRVSAHIVYQRFESMDLTGPGMMRMCLAEPHWFRLSVATAEVFRDSEKEYGPSLIAHFSLSMRGKGFISGLHLISHRMSRVYSMLVLDGFATTCALCVLGSSCI